MVSLQAAPSQDSGIQGDKPVKQFTPGGIHAAGVRSFWENELKANDWVLDTLAHGYALPFHSVPLAQELANNLSARQEEKFVRQEVCKLQAQGVVRFVSEKPTVVSPLTVAVNAKGKKRLCLDLSRTVNDAINIPAVVLADLKAALQITERGDWQGVYDLASAYHHIKIYPEHVKYLGAAFKKTDGSTQYFVFEFLPFGLASAVHVMTKIMKPLSAYIASKGIRHTIYLDDGRVTADSKPQAGQDLETVLEVLEKAGWSLALEKSDTPNTVAQEKMYLGFLIDTASMSVRLGKEKEISLRQRVTLAIEREGKRMSAKDLAKVLGKMVSTAPALGKISLIFARTGYALLEETVDTRGWSASLTITKEVVESLKLFLDSITEFNGNPISHTDQAVSLLSLVGPPDTFLTGKVLPTHVKDLPKKVFVSDASDVAVCAYSMAAGEEFFFIGKLESDQVGLSSGHRELLAVKLALQARQQRDGPWEERTNVFWLTDSENMVTFLTKGSSKKHIQELVLEIMKMARRLRIVILPIHLRREDPRIKMADAGSRIKDSDDWSIDQQHFEDLRKVYGPFSIDLFADSSNAREERFYSDFLCPHTSGVDAFVHSWNGENAWICPPISKISKVIRKLRFTKLSGIFIVPAWKSADFWPLLFPRGKSNICGFQGVKEIHPVIVQNQRAYSPLVGRTPYSFLAIIIDSM